ncbi:MAG: hypothetical protein Q8S09_00405 [Hyphomonas sp.]|nr:hypothetical protein [Hyphomonas sp.]
MSDAFRDHIDEVPLPVLRRIIKLAEDLRDLCEKHELLHFSRDDDLKEALDWNDLEFLRGVEQVQMFDTIAMSLNRRSAAKRRRA